MSAENKKVPMSDNGKEEKINKVTMVTVDDDDKEIDLVDLGYALMDKLHFIILAFLLGAVLLNAYAYFIVFAAQSQRAARSNRRYLNHAEKHSPHPFPGTSEGFG